MSAAWRTSYIDDWRLLTRARAFDGPFVVVAANHTGDQRGRVHAGRSCIAGPTGNCLARAGALADTIHATVEQSTLEAAREHNPVRQTRGWDCSESAE